MALGCAALALALALAPPARAQTPSAATPKGGVVQPAVEVAHYWISPSERKALDVYRDAWKGLGGKWVDMPNKNKLAQTGMATDMIANGYPPAVIQWNANGESMELALMGVIQDIDDIAVADHWRDFLPQNLINHISYKGHIYFAPVNIHAENWVWTNKKIFDQLKLPVPTSWDGVLSSAAKIKAAGYVPIALGSGAWEISLLFNDIVYSVYGPKGYTRLLTGGDSNAAMEPAMLKALDVLRRLSAYVDPARTGKTWVDATLSMGRGRAGMQFMGDYAKGELKEAGLVVDKDFRCSLAPGTESIYFVVIDAFAFPVTNNEQVRRSQRLFARQIMNVDNQLAFNRIKGSIPPRTDIQRNNLDTCGKVGLDLISRQHGQVFAQSMLMPPQMSQGWIDIVADYFNNPKISPEKAQRQLAEVLAQK
ncbi:MAG TPA: ABC transporter substrate-binding protein [Duganella sp.]|uniref:ABC transporter substrate-binding protein n=1 Tax=Duganella sp. TaxID=1904440 RepID=UPI002ED4E914